MTWSTTLGMPRIGPRRELKRATEAYWAGNLGAAELAEVARERRAASWQAQVDAGIDQIVSNDFSLYDQVLDTCCLVGAVPDRFAFGGGPVDLDTYFAMARGAESPRWPVPAMVMTKWFDTNYHYLVPELGSETRFGLSSTKPLDELREAQALGIRTRPVLVGPVTFLLLARPTEAAFPVLELLSELLPVYVELLGDLAAAGVEWVQLDEPCLATDLDERARQAFAAAYDVLAAAGGPRLLVTSYFGGLGDNLELACGLPLDGLHVDLVRDQGQLPRLLDRLPGTTVLSAGVIDGRNVWRNDLRRTFALLEEAHRRLGDRLWVAPSCSLLHVPHDLDLEPELDPELRSWLAFAHQKLDEVTVVARALDEGPEAVAEALAASDEAARTRRSSPRTRSADVRRRVAALGPSDATRRSPYEKRRSEQLRTLALPELPTTTIGSFPQTEEIRRARQRYVSGAATLEEYEEFCRREIERVIRLQEAIGLDVLVHGEPERNDMVQYFGERLGGFACTRNAWVQSYGTRCVRPPILYGDVERPAPITVDWLRYAQSLTASPVKGMLTGPVTILQWSFVRDDQPREETCRQIALAVRDEVVDLEAAGFAMIQVDEPALREGLPLRRAERDHYLAWATECFRLATSAVGDGTQIHTHMCYGEFGDVLDAVAALDADVISMEAARGAMAVLDGLAGKGPRSAIGPGVYDVHSPRVPSEAELRRLVLEIAEALGAERVWVNPDCGLKTRRPEEVEPALANMVAAARSVRDSLTAAASPATPAPGHTA